MYNGYLCIVGGLKLPKPDGVSTNILIDGSYEYDPKDRIAEKWTDQNGEDHIVTYSKKKVYINFRIRQRTAEEQQIIAPILTNTEDVEVTYYDDRTGVYKTGRFRMTAGKSVVAYADEEELYFAEMAVSLEEH